MLEQLTIGGWGLMEVAGVCPGKKTPEKTGSAKTQFWAVLGQKYHVGQMGAKKGCPWVLKPRAFVFLDKHMKPP
jgi:hypothetical protein